MGDNMIKAMQYTLMLLLSLTLLSGCDSVPFMGDDEEEPKITTLNFKVGDKVNPDPNGNSLPVVVRIHELSSRTLFDANDFFSLFEKPEEILGADMIGKEEFEFTAGKKLKHERELASATRFIGILVAYRDIDNARWRAVIKVDPKADKKFLVALENLSIYTEEQEE